MTYSNEDQDWFLKLANTQYIWKASTQMSFQKEELEVISSSCVSVTTYKMFLSRILGYCDQNDDSADQPPDQVSDRESDLESDQESDLMYNNFEVSPPYPFYGPQGHLYNCFPWG